MISDNVAGGSQNKEEDQNQSIDQCLRRVNLPRSHQARLTRPVVCTVTALDRDPVPFTSYGYSGASYLLDHTTVSIELCIKLK